MIKEKLAKCKNKIAGAVAFVGATLGTGLTAFAAEVNQEAVDAAKSLLTSATATLNIANVVAIIGAGIGAVLGLFLAWWGGRKLVNMLINVFKKGKIKL